MTRLLAPRRTLAAFAALPLLLVGLAACGDQDGSGSDTSASSGTPASGVAYTAGDNVPLSQFGQRLASGFAQLTTAHATLKADIGQMGTVTGEGDFSRAGGQPAAAMTINASSLGSDVQVRLVDGVVYANLGQISQDKYWKLDLSDQHGPMGRLRSQLDPKALVEKLQKAITSVTYVGAEGGLDHYQVSVAPRALAGGMGSMGMGSGMGLMGMHQMGSTTPSVPKTVTVDLWLDHDNRLNKLTADAGDLGSVELTLSDFNAKVDITAPPASEVTTMPQFSGDLMHSAA